MEVSAQGQREMLGSLLVSWKMDGDGKLWIDTDGLYVVLSSMERTNREFARGQSAQMAPQASYDIGKAKAAGEILNLLALFMNGIGANRGGEEKEMVVCCDCDDPDPEEEYSMAECAKQSNGDYKCPVCMRGIRVFLRTRK